jgi:glucosyl-dolichyl phosphate glucuronosyltransferase
MRITVILCTYNRCRSLARALESVAASELPISVEWDVLVVDNNSRDQTREVIQAFCRRYPGRFQYVFEPHPGKSHALNRGIREARGRILAFIDDDVTVDPTWLQNLIKAMDDNEWAGVGGRILPSRTFSCPDWLVLEGRQSMAGILALFDRGPERGELTEPPYGTNMAFRRDVFEKYGDFRIDLGPAPGSEIRNEDTEFGRRIMAVGERLRYEPAAVVYHEIPQNRLSKQYFLKWWFDYGRAQVREKGRRLKIWGIPRQYFSIPNITLRHLSKRTLQWLLAFNPRERFYRKCMVWVAAGWLAGTYQSLLREYEQSEKRNA